MMLPIVNARGVPGTIAALARGRDGLRYAVTCWHVLYGGGAETGATVFAMEVDGWARRFAPIGRAAGGEFGRVDHRGELTFLDCALVQLVDVDRWPDRAREILRVGLRQSGLARARAGARVHKCGWITGVVHGIVEATDHYDRPIVEGRTQETPGQLFIRAERRDRCFSVAGESGAAVLDEDDRIVGIVWGCTTAGDGIACPATVAFARLGVELDGDAS